MCLGYAVFFGNIVLMPLWLQSFLGYTATWAGLVSAPSGVTAVLTSLVVGRLMRRYDPRVLAATSFGLYAISYFMRAGLTADASFMAFMAPQLVQGFAMGMFFVSMLAVIFDGLPPQKIPAASGLSNFLRITAGSFATSLTTTFWDRREALHQTRLADAVSVYAPAYQQSLVADASVRFERSGRGGRDDPGSDRAELSACPRSISSICPRGCASGAASAVLSGAPAGCYRRCPGGGGLMAAHSDRAQSHHSRANHLPSAAATAAISAGFAGPMLDRRLARSVHTVRV